MTHAIYKGFRREGETSTFPSFPSNDAGEKEHIDSAIQRKKAGIPLSQEEIENKKKSELSAIRKKMEQDKNKIPGIVKL